MRFQALGDMVITLPYLHSLKRQLPRTELHFLTRKEISGIPEKLELFDRVIALQGGRKAKTQVLFALLKLPLLLWQSYDAVLDLQNNKISRLIRKLLRPKAWSEFDKYSPFPAGDRVKLAIEALGPWRTDMDTDLKLNLNVDVLLSNNNWKKDQDLVLLNPAGNFLSRNWPLKNYVEFANKWLKRINPKTQFVLLLMASRSEEADFIADLLTGKCINLTGKADQTEAFAIIRKCRFVLSEDSGLMHMAWTQGIPTLALFGSSRKDWSQPLGKQSLCLDSSDMECGPCMREVCRYDDNRCLTRYTPDVVIQHAMTLIQTRNVDNVRSAFRSEPLRIPIRTALYNLVRRFFKSPILESLLLSKILGRPLSTFFRKLIPPVYLYKQGTFRFVQRDQINYALDISRLIDHSIFFDRIRDAGWANLFKYVNPEMVVVDTGANIGYLTLQFARACPRGSVFSFEPDTNTYRDLRRNIELNPFKNITTFPIALGDQSGTADLYKIYPRNPGANRILSGEPDGSYERETIRVATMDEVVEAADISRIDVWKIDVEGYELAVLRGGHTSIRKWKPILFIELVDENLREHGWSGSSLVQYIEALGYEILDARTMVPIDRFAPHGTDVLCFSKSGSPH